MDYKRNHTLPVGCSTPCEATYMPMVPPPDCTTLSREQCHEPLYIDFIPLLECPFRSVLSTKIDTPQPRGCLLLLNDRGTIHFVGDRHSASAEGLNILTILLIQGVLAQIDDAVSSQSLVRDQRSKIRDVVIAQNQPG